MGFGQTAKEALSYAVKAIQAIAEVKATVQQIQISAQQHEQRTNSRVDALESRIRDLERDVAKLGGAVSSGFTKAMEMVLVDAQNRKSAGASKIGAE